MEGLGPLTGLPAASSSQGNGMCCRQGPRGPGRCAALALSHGPVWLSQVPVLALQRPRRSATPPVSGACPCWPCPPRPPAPLAPTPGPGRRAPAWKGLPASPAWTSETVPATHAPSLTRGHLRCQAHFTVSPHTPLGPNGELGVVAAGGAAWGRRTGQGHLRALLTRAVCSVEPGQCNGSCGFPEYSCSGH